MTRVPNEIPGVEGPSVPGGDTILTPEALAFVGGLVRRFAPRVRELLEARLRRQAALDSGEMPAFLAETEEIRTAEWQVDPLPADLLDRRVEITGPVDRKMIINALNSGASVFMADFEDSNAPTWQNCLAGQVNLRDAARRTIRFEDAARGKTYELAERIATLMVRPRGWHLVENHVRMGGEAVPAGLVDFGLYFFHNAKALLDRGTGPYFYLPKLENHREARLWNDVFVHAQSEIGIPEGTIKATVLIETLPAAFEMHEILHELRRHSAGLNCGRWDYIFSFIKTFRNHPGFVLPDRAQVTMAQPCMRAYTQLLVQTCHRREVHAMGGMAAQIPIKGDDEANRKALDLVRADKLREARDGHDGTWVAHPGLVPVAREIFDAHMPGKNQIANKRTDVDITAADLVQVPEGTITEEGLRRNIDVGVRYLAAWLTGNGCVPLYNLMEDAATAEISRTQIWQWLRHGAHLDGGQTVTREYLSGVLDEMKNKTRDLVGDESFAAGRYPEAFDLFAKLSTASSLEEFLTLPAYKMLQE